jgi:hypothetical protein
LPNAIIHKYKIIINSDDYLDEIRNNLLYNINIYTNIDDNLLIYGVKASRAIRAYQIWLNDPLYKKVIRTMPAKDLNEFNITKGNFGVSDNYKYSIGLSFELRKLLSKKKDEKISLKWLKIIQEVIKKCVA